MRKIKYFFYKNGQIILFIIIICCLIFFTFGCSTVKTTTQTTTVIDTVYINPVIDTVKVFKKYKIEKDTLIFDTIRAENKFSKVRVFPVNGKIEVELISKPFETVLQATKTENKTIKQPIKNNAKKWLLTGFIFGVILSFCVRQFIKFYIK